MSFLDRIKKNRTKAAGDRKVSVSDEKSVKTAGTDQVADVSKTEFSFHTERPINPVLSFVLRRPHMSEKAYDLSVNSKYVFMVSTGATKNEIREAVSRQFGVHVVNVTTTRKFNRGKRYRAQIGSHKASKKATVTLKPGEKIDVFTS